MAFETLRVRLKKMGFRLAALDEVVANSTSEAEREPSHAKILTTLAEDADLFHDESGTAYADIEVKGHRETWNIRVEGFAHWLGRRFSKRLRHRTRSYEGSGRERSRPEQIFLHLITCLYLFIVLRRLLGATKTRRTTKNFPEE